MFMMVTGLRFGLNLVLTDGTCLGPDDGSLRRTAGNSRSLLAGGSPVVGRQGMVDANGTFLVDAPSPLQRASDRQSRRSGRRSSHRGAGDR